MALQSVFLAVPRRLPAGRRAPPGQRVRLLLVTIVLGRLAWRGRRAASRRAASRAPPRSRRQKRHREPSVESRVAGSSRFVGDLLMRSGSATCWPGPPPIRRSRVAVSGLSPADVQAAEPTGFRLYDFATRWRGLNLVLIGLLLASIVAVPYRAGQRWAWADDVAPAGLGARDPAALPRVRPRRRQPTGAADDLGPDRRRRRRRHPARRPRPVRRPARSRASLGVEPA